MNKRNIISVFFLFLRNNKRIGVENFMNYYLLKRWISKNKDYKKPRSIKEIKRVIFLARDLRGTINMNAFQPCKALKKRRIYSEVYTRKLPENLDDSIVIFVKYFPFKEALKAIKKRCILVYNTLDDARPNLLENQGKICDAIIFPNKRMQKDFKYYLSEKTKSFVIYHHWDPRFDKIKTKKENKKFSLAYFGGAPKNVLFFDKIPELVLVPYFPDQLKYKGKFNCFYSLRQKDSYNFLYKPSTKVATAAAAGGNIITSKDCSAVELLGKNYPYFTDTDFNSVKETIEYAKKTFRKKVWFDALKTMKKVKKKTDINNIVNDYINLINSFLVK